MELITFKKLLEELIMICQFFIIKKVKTQTSIIRKGKYSKLFSKTEIIRDFMQQLKKVVSKNSQNSQSSQEPKVYLKKKKEEEEEKMTPSEFKDCNEGESTQDNSESSCYSWSGVSQAIDIKREKRSWEESEEEEEKWSAAFQSQPSTQASTSSQGASSQKIEDKNDGDDDDDYDKTQTQTQMQDETEKISFYLKLGKYKKFKFM